MTRQLKTLHRAAFAALLAGTLLGIRPAPAQEVKPTSVPASFNVRDFGAKGDGATDDTAAIRAAVKAAFERRRIPQHPQYGYFVSCSEVYFPNGHYLISDTIDINAVNLRGEAYAAIEQKDPAKDSFTNPWAWRVRFEGLTFLGGKVQLDRGNPNVDSGHVTVLNCHFKNSGSVAVQMCKGSNSSFFKVENCVFIECRQAVLNACDMAAVKDTWITSSFKMNNQAVIENYGVMHVENLLGVPLVGGDREDWVDPDGHAGKAGTQRWIDNHGVLHVRNSINMAGNVGAFGGLPQQLWPYKVNEIVARTRPAKGNWTRGQFVRNANQEGHWTAAGYVKAAKPAVDEPQGWLCTESGKPGSWQAIPYIGAAEKPAESATGKGEKTP